MAAVAGGVVMGPVGRSRGMDMLIGNTAKRILHASECAIIAVKPRSYTSSIKLGEYVQAIPADDRGIQPGYRFSACIDRRRKLKGYVTSQSENGNRSGTTRIVTARIINCKGTPTFRKSPNR